MVKVVKSLAKVIRIGNSIGCTFDKNLREALDLEIGDIVQLTVEKIETENGEE
jgi:antitoxin component of MazEF toxin-antitoxin module